MLESHVIDWAAELCSVQALPIRDRLPQLIMRAGAKAHPEDSRMLSSCGVKLWCVGGLAACELEKAGLSLDSIAGLARSSMGVAGSMSYVSLPGGTPESAYEKIAVELGHGSCAHVAQVSLVVAGISCAVANEFNSQRDLVHCARVTEARTAAQSSPMVVVLDKSMLPMARVALEACQEQASLAKAACSGAGASPACAWESSNLLFPAAKATALVVSASLRSFQKILAAQDDPGKEDEYRAALGRIRKVLASMWPELFGRSKGSNWEQHWAKPEAFEPLIAPLGFAGRSILEFGAGRGALTKAMLTKGASSIEA